MPEILHRRRYDAWNPRFSVAFTVCVALAVVSGIGVIVGVRRIAATDKVVHHSFEVIDRLEETRAAMRSAISNMRAFMIAADAPHQQAVTLNLDQTRDQLDQVSDLTAQSPATNALYDDFSANETAINSALSDRFTQGINSAAKITNDPSSNAMFSKFEKDVAAQIYQQNQHLTSFQAKRQDDFMLTELAFMVTMVCGSLALMMSVLGVKRETQQRKLLESQNASTRQELQTAQAMLQFADQKDPLCGLLNKEAFERILNQEFEKAIKTKGTLSIIMVHLDQIAQICDVKGVHTCEEILKQAGNLLKDSFRGADVCCRYAESEFAIILPRTGLQNATIAAERARAAIERADWPECNLTASFGVAQADPLKDADELTNRCHQAVDYARRTGRNRVTAIRAYLPLSA